MIKFKLIILSTLSGILFWLGWPTFGFAPLLLVAFVPLLFVEHYISFQESNTHWIKAFLFSYISFLIWNIATTWWIYYSTLFGAVMAIILNAMFMSIVFSLFFITKRKLGNTAGYLALIFYWVAFEYLHTEWDLSWPWLTLGNGFASYYKLIQWYEYTGVFGGSFWIVTSNVLIFIFIKKVLIEKIEIRKLFKLSLIIDCTIFIPIIISYLIYTNYTEKGTKATVVVVQPNIDPYNEKFGGMSYEKQIEKLISLARTKLDTNTDILVAPETAISEGVWEHELNQSTSIIFLNAYLRQYPKLNTIIGLSSYKRYAKDEKPPITARTFVDDKNKFYDAYNSALYVDFSGNEFLYHKSKLVIGVEKIPYPKFFKYFEKLAINLGGTTGSLGTQEERTVFQSVDNKFNIAPVICYESIYGNFVSQYAANGANLICIITNDGWWENTEGHRQHCDYARLRAIECRRSIARSANTGTSCFINQRGDVQQATSWWVPAVIKQEITTNDDKTFYVLHGDYIAKFSAYISVLILSLLVFLRLKRKKIN